ncbi:MAG TPA: CHRD domain-containing protein [Thermoanaerobaculia bacterium]|nr:CHRD domain-containing protein [Thermoanaerobaculia bacterium]
MHRSSVALAFVCVFALLALPASAQTFGAVLTGAQEVPPTTSPGFGNFTGTFDSTRTNITINLTVSNLGAPINGYHIHEKAAGQQSGGIVINFQGLGGTFVNNTLTGTFAVDPAIAARMIANPSNFYVNVHTTQFPGGAIRGDLAISGGQTVTYAADLRGTNEVPSNNSTASGSAFVTIDTTSNTLYWDVVTSGISPTLAHIHGPAPAGTNANVLINFATSAAAFTNGRTSGSINISSLAPDTLNTLLTNPSNFYVNVHSAAFPGGEIRGQLVLANEYDVPVAGRVTNALQQTFVTDLRVFNPSYDASASAQIEYFQSGSTPNTNATQSIAVSVPPRGTAVLDDVAGATGLNVPNTIGAIRVSSASQLAVTSRIYADLRSTGKGTFGQFAAGQPRSNALRRGVLPQLSNHTVDFNSGFRTNVGFFNPNSEPVTVRLELRDAGGALTASSLITLQALSQQQNPITSYFSGVDLTNAANLTMSFDASAPIVGYASVVDNVSADQIFVYAQSDTGVATTQ